MRLWAAAGGSLAAACLLLALGGAAVGSVQAAPTNDNFASARALSGVDANRTGDTNVAATLEAGETVPIAGTPGGASVWYAWTAPSAGVVRIDTQTSDFDTLLGVYTGSSVSTLTDVASNDDWADSTSRVRFAVTSGTTYRIKVDGAFGETGTINLHLHLAVPPSNDNFASATTISGQSITRTADTNEGALLEPGEPLNVGTTQGGASVWYVWTAPVTGPVTLNTSGSTFDTLLGVYTGSSVSLLLTVATNDDTKDSSTSTSLLRFAATSGTTYRFRVDGYLGASGSVHLQLTQIVAPPKPVNDDFANAVTLTTRSASRSGDTNVGATLESLEAPTVSGQPGIASVWYSWTAPVSASVTIDTAASTYDTLLGVYTGSSVADAAGVVSDDDGGSNFTSTVTFDADAGTTYRIRVDGYQGATGAINLHLAQQKGDQDITVTQSAPTVASINQSFTVAATAPGGPVTYSSGGSCTNTGATFTMTSATGACIVLYDQAGNADYNPAPEFAQFVSAQKAAQTITVTTHAPAAAAFNTSFTVAATASGGGAVTFSSSGACTISGSTFTMTSGTGTCQVMYDQPGNATIAPAPQVVETVTAQKLNQSISVSSHAPLNATYNTSFTVAATASGGGAVAFSSSGACSNSGSTFTMNSGTGTCQVLYDQPGNANYNPASQVVELVTAQKASQSINVTSHAPASAVFNTSFGVAANAPGGVVSFSSGGVCSNSGSTFTMTSGTGTCQVRYDQVGNSNYSPASQIVESVTAQKAAQTILVTFQAPTVAPFGSSFSVAASASGGAAVVFSSSGACSNVGATFTMISGTGTCQVMFDQPGNANFIRRRRSWRR